MTITLLSARERLSVIVHHRHISLPPFIVTSSDCARRPSRSSSSNSSSTSSKSRGLHRTVRVAIAFIGVYQSCLLPHSSTHPLPPAIPNPPSWPHKQKHTTTSIIPAISVMSYQAFETMADEEPSLNIPSLLTLAVVSFFVIRWFLNRDGEPGSAGAAAGRSRARGHAVDPAQVEQILQMFPQFSAREITWDLQRNGGSVPATTERILSGRALEVVSTFSSFFSIGCVV